ncbi:MAG: DUF4160 domain-containing protein [Nitrospiraceae bacterium]|nr:MAG: DUF4160 domain-containing protein [Nitrospiraceae bacterium]
MYNEALTPVIDPGDACKNSGFSPKELNTIREIINKKREQITEAWHEHCG